MNLLIYSLAAFGLAWIVGHSKISLLPREWVATKSRFLVSLLECVGCFGVWQGLAAHMLDLQFVRLFNDWRDAIMLALFTCAGNLVLGRFVGVVE